MKSSTFYLFQICQNNNQSSSSSSDGTNSSFSSKIWKYLTQSSGQWIVWENNLFWITQSAEESELFEKITWAILRDITAPNQSPRPVVKTNRLQALKPGLVGGGLPGFHEHSQNCISVFQLLLFSICHSLHFLPKIGITVVEWEPGLCDALDSKYGILGLTLTQ